MAEERFDDIAFASLADPPLSTVCLPREDLGRRAVEALLLSLETAGSSASVDVVIPTYFVARGSTGPVRPVAAQPLASSSVANRV